MNQRLVSPKYQFAYGLKGRAAQAAGTASVDGSVKPGAR